MTPPDIFAQKRALADGHFCRVFLCIFPRKNRVLCPKICINQHQTADPQNGPKSAPFPCENANLTNGTSFVFSRKFETGFFTKMDVFGSFMAEMPNFAVFWGPMGPNSAQLPCVSALFGE